MADSNNFNDGMLPDEQREKLGSSPLGNNSEGAISPLEKKAGSVEGGAAGGLGGSSPYMSAAKGAAGEGSTSDKAQEAGRSALKNMGKGGGSSDALNKVPGLGGDGPATAGDKQIDAAKSNSEKNIDAGAEAAANYFAPGSGKAIEKLGGVRGVLKKAGIVLLIPMAIIGFIVFYIIQNPWESIGKVLTDQKTREFALQVGTSMVAKGGFLGQIATLKTSLGLSEYSPDKTYAAGENVPIKAGSTLEKLSKIDWQKSKFQTLDKSDCGYTLITKPYIFPDGKTKISLPDYVLSSKQNEKIPLENLSNNTTAAYCIAQEYPMYNLLIRQPVTREVNKKSGVHLSYASNKDDPVFSENREKVDGFVYDKTLNRVTSKVTEGPDLSVEPYATAIKKLEGDYAFNVGNFNVNKTNPSEKIPFEESKRDMSAQIKKMYADMADGKSPYDMQVKDYINVPTVEFGSINELNLIASGISTTICPFVFSFMDIRNPDNPVAAKNAKAAIESRLTGALRGSVKPVVLQDTRIADSLNSTESNSTIAQYDNFASSAAYSLDVYNNTNGVQMNPEATHNKAYNVTQQFIYEPVVFEGQTYSINQICNQLVTLTAQNNPDPAEGYRLNQAMVVAYKNLKEKIYAETPTGIFPNASAIGLEQIMTSFVRTGSITAVSGLETGPNNYNRNKMGNIQQATDYWLRTGGRILSTEESQKLALNTENARREEDKHKGIAYRLFNTTNIRSLASVSWHRVITPKTAAISLGGTLKELLNPIRSLASMHGSSLYYLSGDYNKAYAADITGDQYFKVDTAGLPEADINSINMLENAKFIENIRENGSDTQKSLLTQFEQCQQKRIPNKAYFQVSTLEQKDGNKLTGYIQFYEFFPETKRFLDANKNVINDSLESEFNKMTACKFLLLDATDFTKTEHQLAIRYRMYSYYNTQLDLLGKLSSDASDTSIYANNSGGGGGGNSGSVSDRLVLPVDKSGASISSCYGVQRGAAAHSGIDIAYPRGRNVYAGADGEVVEQKGEGTSGGYGNMIYLKHSENLYTLYGHLQEALVSVGTKVKQGDVIGKNNSTGHSTGDHLHFEVSTGPYAARVFKNPIAYTDGLKDLPNGNTCKEGPDEKGSK